MRAELFEKIKKNNKELKKQLDNKTLNAEQMALQIRKLQWYVRVLQFKLEMIDED